MAHGKKFTLRSGNTTSFKDMGSSPLREPVTLIVGTLASMAASAAAKKAKANADAKVTAEKKASEGITKSGESKFTSGETSKISDTTASNESKSNETATPATPATPEQPTATESTTVVGGKSSGDGGLGEEEKEKLGIN